jgi:hypothetical protein
MYILFKYASSTKMWTDLFFKIGPLALNIHMYD